MTSSHARNFDVPTHQRHPEDQPLPKPTEPATGTTGPYASAGTGPYNDPAMNVEKGYDTSPRAPEGASAFTQERPLGVKPTEAGGVAIGGHSDLPEGQATMMDKVVGKTQKVMGKMMNNPEQHERGELRESGGKAAAMGNARAPHD